MNKTQLSDETKIELLTAAVPICVGCDKHWGDNRLRRKGIYKGNVACDTCNKTKNSKRKNN